MPAAQYVAPAPGAVAPQAPVAAANFSRPVGPSSPAPSSPFIGTRISSPAPQARTAPSQVLGSGATRTTPSSFVPRATTPSSSKQGGLAGAIGSLGSGAAASLGGVGQFLTGLGVALPPLLVPGNILKYFNAGNTKPKRA